jgi:hypothetical protein
VIDDWYPAQLRFRARVTCDSVETCSCDLLTPVTTVRVTWWRRWGYALVRHLPTWSDRP